MTLSMPSIFAGAPASGSTGPVSSSGGARAAGGFLDGFLASLSREEEPSAQSPRPTASVVAPPQANDPRPVAAGPLAPVLSTPPVAQGATAAVTATVLAGPVPADPAEDADAVPDAPVPDEASLLRQGQTPPETRLPATPGTTSPAVAGEAAASPRPKATAKGAAAKPAADPAGAERRRDMSDSAVISAAAPPGEPAPVRVAPGTKGSVSQDAGRVQAAQAAQVSRGDGPTAAASIPLAVDPAPTGPASTASAALDGGLPLVPSGSGEPVARSVAPATAQAAGVIMADRADWPQTVASATLAALTPDGGTLTLEMTPEDLGALRITLTLEGDSASVQIETTTPEAARLLNEAERQLSQEFARQGVTLASHDAQMGRRGAQGSHTPDQPAWTGDEVAPSNPVALMRSQGIINLIA